jgi:hypothetical protein
MSLKSSPSVFERTLLVEPACPATHGENCTDTRSPIGVCCWSPDTDNIT